MRTWIGSQEDEGAYWNSEAVKPQFKLDVREIACQETAGARPGAGAMTQKAWGFPSPVSITYG